jgi:hypothetical protein
MGEPEKINGTSMASKNIPKITSEKCNLLSLSQVLFVNKETASPPTKIPRINNLIRFVASIMRPGSAAIETSGPRRINNKLRESFIPLRVAREYDKE